ncbi:glycosyltransferase family 2 protein [Phreatobacter stygius]|uniref:Glycosyltransferase family 2 protein n=1 Tax=Phreatobacter stygius TaxID=1940610 RepID=A0A4D7B586_9HYPH|nr:glycosyltransferase family 2 protein [Phreatobacter stygius]QCI63177.1 glycosyltransferase family 2 protein [Phreatobacter stygius]
MTSVSAEDAIILSVVIPNFNHGAHIGAAVRAAAEQVPPPDEIIVVDDGSTDDSLGVLERLRNSYPQLRIVALPENGGAIRALNRGLQEARGACVYFGAADDLTKPGLFKATLDLLASFPGAAFACAEGEVVDMDTGEISCRPPVRPSLHPKHFTPAEVAGLFERFDNWIVTGAAVVRRDRIVEAGGFDPALGPMADGYALRRLAFLHGCCFAPVTGVIWQIRATGLSRGQAADAEGALRGLILAREMMRADPAFPDWYPESFERRWRFAVSRLAVQARPMNSEVLVQMGGRGPIGRVVLAAAASLSGPLGRLVALAWLTLRERPTSFTGLATTWLSRRGFAPRLGRLASSAKPRIP